jgi:hypothetical protein
MSARGAPPATAGASEALLLSMDDFKEFRQIGKGK